LHFAENAATGVHYNSYPQKGGMMDRDEVGIILNPFLPRLIDCLLNGCQDYLGQYSAFTHIHTKGTRASITRDHIRDWIRRSFATEKSTRIVEKRNGLFLLEVEQRLLLRFKKLNSRKCSANVPTGQTKRFYRQQPLFPGLWRTNLNAGYIANETWTEFEFYITEPSGSRSNAWVMKIQEYPECKPIVDITPARKEKPKRVKAKTASEKGANDERTDS
jgi:hypothetical protein